MKGYKVLKDQLKVVDGRVIIDSEELANMIENELIDIENEESVGLNVCGLGCNNDNEQNIK